MFPFVFVPMLLLGYPIPAETENVEVPAEANHTIVVEAHKDIEVYVAPIQIRNEAPEIEAVIGEHSVFRLASRDSRNAKVPNGYGGYVKIGATDEQIKVFSQETIEYAWDNCDYKTLPKKCSYNNGHYLLETYVTVDVHQLVVEMLLYDPDLQVVASASKTSNLKINWIKQQEIQSQTVVVPNGQQSASGNCNENSCQSISQPATPTTITNTSKPKEEMPLRWEIPHMLLEHHISQCSLGLWIGTKIKN